MDEVISVCHSLQRIAEHAPHMEAEIGQFFHDVIIPRLLGLALQAAVQGKICCLHTRTHTHTHTIRVQERYE